MAWTKNPFTDKLDNKGDLSQSTADSRYLKIDQTTPQTVVNGEPKFDSGLFSNDDIRLKVGKKLIFDAI